MSKTIYLAGPIGGLSFDGAQDWRDAITKKLARHGIKGLSPLRNQEYLRAAGILTKEATECAQFDCPLSSPFGLTTRDRNDVMTCDLVIANYLGADRMSLGTAMEVGWADAFRKPCITIMEPGGVNPNEHAMISATTLRVHSIDEAVRVAASLLGA